MAIFNQSVRRTCPLCLGTGTLNGGEWLPISTAPKQSNHYIDLWCVAKGPEPYDIINNGVRVENVLWHKDEKTGEEGWATFCDIDYTMVFIEMEPFYWMPIPDPPKRC